MLRTLCAVLLCLCLLFSACAEANDPQYRSYYTGNDVCGNSDEPIYNGYWGVEDRNGNVVIEANYEDLRINTDCTYAAVKFNNAWGVIDMQGNTVIPCNIRYEDMTFLTSSGDRLCVQSGGKCGVMDLNGDFLIEPAYDGIAYAADGYYTVYSKEYDPAEADFFSGDGTVLRAGLIAEDGTLVLPAEYDTISVNPDTMVITAVFRDSSSFFRLNGSSAEPVKQVSDDFDKTEYAPFTGAKTARLNEKITLEKRADETRRHPVMDCATALYPVASAIITAVYPEKTGADMLLCSKTSGAYKNLIDGTADIILCAEPSAQQLEAAKDAGTALKLTPFGREAFVFIVNRDNPVSDLSSQQIRDIYSGRITDWSELGADGLGEIIAFQRPENSGSQTALLSFMGDTPVMQPPVDRVEGDMFGMIETVSDYTNLSNAIGYTFRFYCTDLVGGDVKLLSIDGVAPTVENIRSGAYPLISELYCVTREGDSNGNVQALVDWITSEQGQRLVEKTGYVPVKGAD